MSQNEPRYHAAFMELARNSHVRPLRSRTGFGWTLAVFAFIAFGAGIFSYFRFYGAQKIYSVHAPASTAVVAAPVAEVFAEQELTPDSIEKWQNKLNNRPDDGP